MPAFRFNFEGSLSLVAPVGGGIVDRFANVNANCTLEPGTRFFIQRFKWVCPAYRLLPGAGCKLVTI